MATLRYFKKHIPENPITLSNGSRVKFTSSDGLLGYYSTDQQFLQDEFSRFIREQKFGIIEIDAKTFKSDFLEKKNPAINSSPVWRDEMGRGAIHGRSLIPESLDVALVVGVSDPKRPELAISGAAEAASIPKPAVRNLAEQVKDFQPPVGPRKKRSPLGQ